MKALMPGTGCRKLAATFNRRFAGKVNTGDDIHNILGIVEPASRANLVLIGLKNKASITLLRHLVDTIEKYGKPKMTRIDNELIFTSRLFRLGLWWLGSG